ncbi:hypothetical protein [Streptomyces sp. NPDC090135]|uniref:hypothetical protein n=1 Tax=Streptomyces sp. NPDC090135 TaxID=3365957 RepID=UPI003805B460
MSSGQGGAGDLDPLDENLPEPVRAFAGELRVLFRGLDTSVRRYAQTHHMNSSTLSRYLSGKVIPQWAFVLQLMEDNAATSGSFAAEVPGHLKTLYDAALRAAKPNGDTAHRLRDELDRALADLERARTHEQVLSEALHLRETRIRELQGRLALEQAQRSQDHITHAAELEIRNTEITSLRRQVADLKNDLERVHSHTTDLEQRASTVEENLALAEAGADAAGDTGNETSGGQTIVITSASPGRRTVEQTQTLRQALLAVTNMVDVADGFETMVRLLGPGGPHIATLLERPAHDPVPDIDLERLTELLQMALARQEPTAAKSHSLSRMVGRRPYETARADLYASAFCLMLAALHQSRNQHELQRAYLGRAKEHFEQGYPHFMGKPAATGSKYNYRAGSVSYVTDIDKAVHAFNVEQIKERFDACQKQLTPPPAPDAPTRALN